MSKKVGLGQGIEPGLLASESHTLSTGGAGANSYPTGFIRETFRLEVYTIVGCARIVLGLWLLFLYRQGRARKGKDYDSRLRMVRPWFEHRHGDI